MAPSSRENGFSLVELMVVSGVIAIMAGIAVPSITSAMRQYNVTSASQDVAATIRAARVQAVGKNSVVRVDLDVAARTYQLWNVGADVALGGEVPLPTGIEFVDADNDVDFSTSGRLQNPGLAPITIIVGNGDESQNRTITVTASGRVQLN